MNKKGIIHTLEAFIAILVVLSFSYLLYAQSHEFSKQGTPEIIRQAEKSILMEAALNTTYQDCIANKVSYPFGECKALITANPCVSLIQTWVDQQTPPGFSSTCEICDRALSCMTSTVLPTEKDVYANSIMIAGNPGRVFRVYFWEK